MIATPILGVIGKGRSFLRVGGMFIEEGEDHITRRVYPIRIRELGDDLHKERKCQLNPHVRPDTGLHTER